MADREDFATAVGALIKGRALASSSPTITEIAATRRVALTTPAGTVVEIGNTGNLVINGNAQIAGALSLVRDGTDVTISAAGIDVQALGTHNLYTLPVGFRPRAAAYENTVAYFASDTGGLPVRAFPSGSVNVAMIPPYPTGQDYHRFNFTLRFATGDPWPTTLPGA